MSMRLFCAAFLAAATVFALDASAQCSVPTSRLLDAPALSGPLTPRSTLFYPEYLGQNLHVKSINAGVIYSAAPWVAGRINGEVRASAEEYQNDVSTHFQPGPLTSQGAPTADGCGRFNRVWIVTRADLNAYAASGTTTADLREWPSDAGAPVTDGDGIPGNYNLAGGDRPTLWGSSTAWYVLNDVAANAFLGRKGPGLGLEVQVTIGALANALPGSLIVRHRLVYKPTTNDPLTDAYFGIWSDGDLGRRASDDYVGTDSTLGLFYYYNADNNDGDLGSTPIPAVGQQILQGPRVDIDGNGSPETTLGATSSISYMNSGWPYGFPTNPQDHHNYLRGVWRNGSRITLGGNGYGGTQGVHFIYPAFPTGYWSMENVDGLGRRGVPLDQVGLISTGPFTMQPGETQDIVSAFSVALGADRIDAVRELRIYSANLASNYSAMSEAYPEPELTVTLGPNPTRGSLRGTVPTGQPATVALYDLLGRELHTLATLPRGGAFTADVSEATPGVYFVRIKQGTATAWHRLVVVR